MIAENPSVSIETLQACLQYHPACWPEAFQNPAADASIIALALDLRTAGPETRDGEHAEKVEEMLRRTKSVGVLVKLPRARREDFRDAEARVLKLRTAEVRDWLREHHPDMAELPLEWVRDFLAMRP